MARCILLCLGLLFLVSSAAHGAEATAPPKNVTLADVLKALPQSRLPDQGVLLTVAPEQVRLPASAQKPNDVAPPDMVTLDTVVAAYNRSTQVFGHVIALAPPTMTVLNTDPALASVPLADLVQKNPLPFLLGTLTESQLHLLGTTGLGMDDLTADQQSLLQAVLPHPFRLAPTASMPPSLSDDEMKTWKADDWANWEARLEALKQQTVTLSDTQMRGVRLQAQMIADYSFEVPGQGGYFVGVSPGGQPSSNGTGLYTLSDYGYSMPATGRNDRLQSEIRSELPNELKAGDLRWTQRALDANVSLLGLHTVGELVSRLATATGLELHCDPHYAGQSLLILGATDRPRGADEVMQALTFCVCGAWRQVGPSWVLTDDVQGVGTRRAMLNEIVAIWGNRLDKAAQAVGDHLNDMGWTRALSFTPGAPAALPTSLQGTVSAQTGKVSGFGVPLAWEGLPQTLRNGIKRELDDLKARSDGEASAVKVEAALGPDTTVYVSLNMKFDVFVPGYGVMPLMLNNEYRVPHSEPHGGPLGGSPRQKPIKLTEATRGILVAPSTPALARQVVDRMAVMGFNALFCDVFTGGRTFFPNTALPPASDANAGVLAAAISEGRAKGVAVYAVLDTLCWRAEGPDAQTPRLPAGFTEDLTIQGETFAEDFRRREQAGSLDPQTPADWVRAREAVQRWISPAEPQARAVLPALVKTLAATPGLAGLVLQDTAAPGYLGGGATGDPLAPELGYTLANRLGRIRSGEADPIDVGGGRDASVYFYSQDANVSATLNVSLPSFGDGEAVVSRPWDQFRADADHALLASLYAAAREAASGLPLWMRERRIGFTLDPWTDARQLNEAADLSSEGNALGKRATAASILAVTLDTFERHDPNMLPDIIQQFRQEFGDGRAGGLVLDLQTVAPSPDPTKDLELVAPYFTPAVVR